VEARIGDGEARIRRFPGEAFKKKIGMKQVRQLQIGDQHEH
jgi:hypothetical protein